MTTRTSIEVEKMRVEHALEQLVEADDGTVEVPSRLLRDAAYVKQRELFEDDPQALRCAIRPLVHILMHGNPSPHAIMRRMQKLIGADRSGEIAHAVASGALYGLVSHLVDIDEAVEDDT